MRLPIGSIGAAGLRRTPTHSRCGASTTRVFEAASYQIAARADSQAPVANQPSTARLNSAGLLAISQWFDLMTERAAFGSNAKFIASCQARLSSATTKRVGQDTLRTVSG